MNEYTPDDDEIRQMANSHDGVPNDVFDRWLTAHDAAVEAAVRADQIEKDAQIAKLTYNGWSKKNPVAAAIRAQLPVTGLDTEKEDGR